MLDRLHAEVLALSDPERAYHQRIVCGGRPGGYAQDDEFVGLTAPQVRSLARACAALSLEEAQQLLRSSLHEERAIALRVLVNRSAGSDDATRQRIYDVYLANTAYVNNWDLVDASAPQIVGAYLEGRPTDVLFRLAASASIWERRIAMLATQHFLRRGEPALTLQLAEALLHDRHDLIHKAVGWMLREMGKRCGRELLTSFLDRHAATMPRTALRYALEHLPPDQRRHYLGLGPGAVGPGAGRR